jgi:hypothetical protein
MGKPLDPTALAALLKPQQKKKAEVKHGPHHHSFEPPPQVGPLRLVDTGSACIVAGYYEYTDPNDYTTKTWKKRGRKCGSPTFLRLLGSPICHAHAVRKMNEMIIELTDGKKSEMEIKVDDDNS